TDELVCPDSSLEFEDDAWRGAVVWPKTPVKSSPFHPLKWTVDPCRAENKSAEGIRIVLEVEKEECEIKLNFFDHSLPHLYMLVHPCDAEVSVTLPDGRVGKGKATLPRTISDPQGHGVWLVRAVLVEGEV